MMKEIKQDEYQVNYDPASATVVCRGSFRLRGEEYEPILDLLNEALDARPAHLMLDVSGLQFLNSSGINTLSKFVLRMRQQNGSKLTIKGSEQHPWQKKSLTNLQRLLPTLQLEIAS